MLEKIKEKLKSRYIMYQTKQVSGDTLITICNSADKPLMSFTIDKEWTISNFSANGSFYQINEIMEIILDTTGD